jgi:hypothetical protein
VLGVALALVAFWRAPKLKKSKDLQRKFALVSAIGFLSYTLVFSSLVNVDLAAPLGLAIQERFWLMPLLVMAIWAGLGLARFPKLAPLFALLSLSLIPLSWSRENQSHETAFREYAMAVLESLPPRSILLTEGDLAHGALNYVQAVLKRRPDVDLLDSYALTRPWGTAHAQRYHPDVRLPAGVMAEGGYTLLDFLNQNSGRPVLAMSVGPRGANSIVGKFRIIPWGGVSWLASENIPFQNFLLGWKQANTNYFSRLQLAAPKKNAQEPGQSWRELLAADTYDRRMIFAISLASIAGNQKALLLEAQAVLNSMRGDYSDCNVLFWKNLGVLNYRIYELEPTPEHGRAVHEAWRIYLNRGKDLDSDRRQIEEILAAIKM